MINFVDKIRVVFTDSTSFQIFTICNITNRCALLLVQHSSTQTLFLTFSTSPSFNPNITQCTSTLNDLASRFYSEHCLWTSHHCKVNTGNKPCLQKVWFLLARRQTLDSHNAIPCGRHWTKAFLPPFSWFDALLHYMEEGWNFVFFHRRTLIIAIHNRSIYQPYPLSEYPTSECEHTNGAWTPSWMIIVLGSHWGGQESERHSKCDARGEKRERAKEMC